MRKTTDILVIGGGIIGIQLALRAKEAQPDARVLLIEKEAQCGLHASGRNSGVLHAGFYYTADSLKARFTRDGNASLTRYCEERRLPMNRCGKLVVAADESELAGLDELKRRAECNGIRLDEISRADALAIEPQVRTVDRALFSPTTSTVDPVAVVNSFIQDALALGVQFCNATAYRKPTRNGVRTDDGPIEAGYIINAAGLYADIIARDFGFGTGFEILPFKGLYLYPKTIPEPPRVHIYPVPNLDNPFLGVHWTIAVDGAVKLGPTAIPALWREHYKGLSRFRSGEFARIAWREFKLFARNDFGFRDLAVRELPKYSKPHLLKLGGRLLNHTATGGVWGRPGIRAQLYDRVNRRLEMDFSFEGDDRSFHVLNAVSPAFTCAIPFSAFLWSEIASRLDR